MTFQHHILSIAVFSVLGCFPMPLPSPTFEPGNGQDDRFGRDNPPTKNALVSIRPALTKPLENQVLGHQYALGIIPVTSLVPEETLAKYLAHSLCSVIQEALQYSCSIDLQETTRTQFDPDRALHLEINDPQLRMNAYDLLFTRFAVVSGDWMVRMKRFGRSASREQRFLDQAGFQSYELRQTAWTAFPTSTYLTMLLQQGLRQFLAEQLSGGVDEQ